MTEHVGCVYIYSLLNLQMITEWLFMVYDTVLVSKSSEITCQFIEENAMYYATGYVVQKLIRKFRSSDDACISTTALLHMVGEDTSAGAIDENGSYLEYVKARTKATDRGGLKHASDDTSKSNQCFFQVQ